MAPPRDECSTVLRTIQKTSAARKQPASSIDTSGIALAPAAPAAREIKTVLVAQYGWPTEAMLPSRKQPAKRR